MTLLSIPAEPWPRDAGWLVAGYNCTELGLRIVHRALRDVGIVEDPLGSNRRIRIDAMTRRAGLVPPQWWCAIWAGAVFADAGAKVPAGYPLTDKWLPYITDTPTIGAAILYGHRRRGPVRPDMDAQHIGIVVRLEPLMLTIEGNRGFAGATSNGVAVDIGPVVLRRILGYVHPVAAEQSRVIDRLQGCDGTMSERAA